MSQKDYYSLLGVSKSASADEIKKAFRTLAHKHHPDKQGGDEVKFKEINEAYQVLSDSQKRQQYDQFGSNFEQAGYGGFGGAQGFNWQDFAQQGGVQFDMGDLGDMFGDFFGGGRGRSTRKQKGADIQIDVTIEFKESIFGVNKTVELYKGVACNSCTGTGGEAGSAKTTCDTCKGSGQVTSVQRTILGNIQTRQTCSKCSGRGSWYEKQCKKCAGSGVTKEKQSISIPIPAGIEHGAMLQMSQMGEAAKHGGIPGDLYIKVRVKEDARFERDGYNLYSRVDIPFYIATLGGEVIVDTVDGEHTLKVPEGTQSGSEFTIKQKGVTHSSGRRGDFIVTVQVAVPKKISREQRKTLEDLGL